MYEAVGRYPERWWSPVDPTSETRHCGHSPYGERCRLATHKRCLPSRPMECGDVRRGACVRVRVCVCAAAGRRVRARDTCTTARDTIMHDSVGHMHSAPHIQTRIGELTTTFLSLSHPLLSHLSISFSLKVSAESAPMRCCCKKSTSLRGRSSARASWSAITPTESDQASAKLELVVEEHHAHHEHVQWRHSACQQKTAR